MGSVNSRPVDSLVAGPPRRGSDSPSSFERALAVSTAIGSVGVLPICYSGADSVRPEARRGGGRARKLLTDRCRKDSAHLG